MFEETRLTKSVLSQRGRRIHTKITDKLLGVVINKSSFLYGLFDSCKVGVGQNHVGSEFSDVCAAPHSDTNVRLFQRRSVIDTVTGLTNV